MIRQRLNLRGVDLLRNQASGLRVKHWTGKDKQSSQVQQRQAAEEMAQGSARRRKKDGNGIVLSLAHDVLVLPGSFVPGIRWRVGHFRDNWQRRHERRAGSQFRWA